MNEVFDFLIKDLKININDTVVAAVSGGPDSMALLNLLLEIRNEISFNIVCAHVNHNVRIESDEEAAFVAIFCHDNDITFEMMKIENYDKENFHSESRSKRYKYFEEMILKYKAKYLFTAHHGDDLMETILMRIVRGSTLFGYSGFSKIINMKDYKLVRPLISLTKEQIINYCEEKEIKYVVDQSNKSNKYTRNRFRKNILPFLKKENPNVHEKFYKFSKLLLEYDEYVTDQTITIVKDIYKLGKLNINKFNNLKPFMKNRVINMILENYYNDNLNLIDDRHVVMILDLIANKKSNMKTYLPNNVIAFKTYKYFGLKENNLVEKEYNLELDKIINLSNGKNIEKIEKINENSNNICRLDSKEIALPLKVRNKKDGDRMQIKGMLGTKKISDIFIDEKVEPQERNLWPIVTDANEDIVWLPGLKKSKFDKLKNEKCDIILKYY
jgi:tRNA(Ile)-lysidine synthase